MKVGSASSLAGAVLLHSAGPGPLASALSRELPLRDVPC